MLDISVLGAVPCPFCGEDPPIKAARVARDDWYFWCPACGARGPGIIRTFRATDEAWNTRPPIASPRREGLMPCPFCGGAHLEVAESDAGSQVTCDACGAWGPPARQPKSAAARWNRRSKAFTSVRAVLH